MKTTTAPTALLIESTESALLPAAKEVLFFIQMSVAMSAIALFVASAWV